MRCTLGIPVRLHWFQISLATDPNGESSSHAFLPTDMSNAVQVLGLVPNGILAVWPAGLAIKQFAFLTVNIHLVTAVL